MQYSDLRIPFVSPAKVLSAAIVLPALGIVVVALRFYSRFSQKLRVGPDDILILLSLIFVVGMGVVQTYGVAKHSVAYPTPGEPETAEQTLTILSPEQRLVELVYWITWVLMIPANGFIKLSALCFYRRIFVVNRRSTFDIVVKVMIVICALWTISFLLATLLGCGVHVDWPWAPLGRVAQCGTDTRLDAMMVSDLVTEILVWVLPIPVIWSLHMTFVRKLTLTGIFMLAAVSLGAAVVRSLVEFEIHEGGYAALTDIDLTLTVLLYWSMLESGLAMIAASLPTLQYLITHFVGPKVLSSAYHNLSSLRCRLLRSRAPFHTQQTGRDGPYSTINSEMILKTISVDQYTTPRSEETEYMWDVEAMPLKPANAFVGRK